MGFSPKVKKEVLVACGRHCCICHKFCGLKIEIHHIIPKSENGEDTFENAIPLCFDCHADMSTYDHKHPKGTKYSYSELRTHRDLWYKKIANKNLSSPVIENTELDRKVYEEIIKLLPWDGSIRYLRIHDFRTIFDDEFEISLIVFCSWSDNPAFEFIDTDLESLKIKLLNDIKSFLSILGHNSFHVKTMGEKMLYRIPKEWSYELPEKYKKVTDEVNYLGYEICKTYDELIKTCRRRLF